MKSRKNGGDIESPSHGVREYEQDTNPVSRVHAPKITGAAEQRKRGGRAKKMVGNIAGMSASHAGRAPRKSGGRTGSNMNPLSSAHKGTPPRGHKGVEID